MRTGSQSGCFTFHFLLTKQILQQTLCYTCATISAQCLQSPPETGKLSLMTNKTFSGCKVTLFGRMSSVPTKHSLSYVPSDVHLGTVSMNATNTYSYHSSIHIMVSCPQLSVINHNPPLNINLKTSVTSINTSCKLYVPNYFSILFLHVQSPYITKTHLLNYWKSPYNHISYLIKLQTPTSLFHISLWWIC